MLLKLLTAVGVLIALWGLARRLVGDPGSTAGPRAGAATDLERCARCGAWRAPETACACQTPPTP
jgi:hypothetical protein